MGSPIGRLTSTRKKTVAKPFRLLNAPSAHFLKLPEEPVSARLPIQVACLSNRSVKPSVKSNSNSYLPKNASKTKTHTKAASHQYLGHRKTLKSNVASLVKKTKQVKVVKQDSKYLKKESATNLKSINQIKDFDVLFELDDVISTEGDERKEYNVDFFDEVEFCREMTKKSLSTIKDESRTPKGGFSSSFRNDLSAMRGTPNLLLDEEGNRSKNEMIDLSSLSNGTDKTEVDEMNLTDQKSRHGIF